MIACGFRKSRKVAAKFLTFVNDEDSETGFVQVSEFEITKEEYLKEA